MTIQLIIEFVIAIAMLIFVHEFGHFIVMRLLKIEVEEFGFGFPPRMLTLFELGGTKFTLNWLPFGGFVRPKGEQDPNIHGGLAAANPWKRIAALLAGPTMNLLTAIVLFILISAIIGYLPDRSVVLVGSTIPDLPASTAGLQAGDILVSIGGVQVNSDAAARSEIYANLGKPLSFVYERNGVTYEVSITPLANPGESGAIGIGLTNPTRAFTVWGAIPESFNILTDYLKQLFSMLGQMIRGQTTNPDERVVGFKGMFDIYSFVRESASTPGAPTIAKVLFFFASISISLGIMNLLPIPALDGGRILFTLPEIIIRNRIPPKYEVWVNFISFALLILLMIYINAQDFIHPIVITPTP